ncbi:MAG: acetate kinase [Bacteroidales bacterium]|nr:acetate kinase [Bacteroidales bacterium]MDE6439837.1 acetate kinase [Bacteroidales bacterium]
MKILVLNCGSSSIKYQLIDMKSEEETDLLAKGLVERIGLDHADLTHQAKGKDKLKVSKPVSDHAEGINWVLEYLIHPQHGVIKDVAEIGAVGHRVAHGGEKFKESVLVNAEVMADLEACVPLAPLHNPANLKGITSMQALLPNVPQCAVFDTSFHQTMPDYAYMYGIPYEYYEKKRMRRYGFHGTSHRFVAQKACRMTGMDINKTRIISCHLGNGASIAAVQNGKSVDTSMGYTPVEGLLMGTRTGDLDLGVVLTIMQDEHLTPDQATALFNKKSGMQGVSGVSSDMRDLWAAAESGNDRARLALDMFIYRVKKYVGAYAAAMGGADIILFTGGIGENDFHVRARVCEGLEYMGVSLDRKLNDGLRGEDTVISTPDSKVKVLLVSTDEEKVIATDTYRLIR